MQHCSWIERVNAKPNWKQNYGSRVGIEPGTFWSTVDDHTGAGIWTRDREWSWKIGLKKKICQVLKLGSHDWAVQYSSKIKMCKKKDLFQGSLSKAKRKSRWANLPELTDSLRVQYDYKNA